mgnify:FL=1
MNIEIPMKILSDEKGYLDRQCPNENCLFEFKVNMQDWEDKVSDEEVHCPLCGQIAPSDSWYTYEQLDAMQEIATNWARNYMLGEIDKMFGSLARSTRNNKYIKITYKRNRPVTFVNNPIGAKEEWTLDITCEKCGTRYSVIGSAYFCPCCGYNSASNVFDNSMDTITKMIQSLDDMKATLTAQFGRDTAETMCRSMLENSFGQVVSAFQKFAQCKFKELSGVEKRVNDFQMVDKGSKYFRDETGSGYEAFLSPNEIDSMKLYFQRRHIIEHNTGIVDQQYIDKTGDTDYSVGQRIVVKTSEALELIAIIKKLASGLITLT